jgi:hypothetical protein
LFLVSLALDHHGPDHPCDLVGKCDGGDLGRPPRQQAVRAPVLSAMDLGIADDGERAGDEQAAQIAITLLVISCISRRESHWQSRLLRNHRH